MEPHLGKKYKLTDSKNFDEIMQHLGINIIIRKAAAAVTPTYILYRRDDGIYEFHVQSVIKNSHIEFKLGEEFIETRADGVKVKSTITIEGNVLKQTQEEDNGRKTYTEMAFTDDTLTIVTTTEEDDYLFFSCRRRKKGRARPLQGS